MGIMRKTNLPIIDFLQTISIKSLNKDNILRHSSYTGMINFFRNGIQTGSINIQTKISNEESYIRLSYNIKDKKYNYVVKLLKVQSNLKKDSFYYYFLCPVTGNKSTKLYLFNGIFRARTSFKYIYDSQTESKFTRDLLSVCESFTKINKIEKKLFRLYKSNIDRKDKSNSLIKRLDKLENKQNLVMKYF